MKKSSVFILLLLMAFLPDCFSQTDSAALYAKESFTKTDSTCTNETGLPCSILTSNLKPGLYMQVCYWDALKTRIASVHFKENGKYNGPCKYWTPDGYVSMEGSYANSKKDGKWTYYTGLKLSSEEGYKNGKKAGLWKEYDGSGKVIKEKKYGKN